jgi:hypothetical protein
VLKRLINILLILAVGASLAMGLPVHSGGSESSMVDCCKKAREQNDSPSVAAARLCCAINCNDPASTSGNPGQSFSRSSSQPSHLVIAPPPTADYKRLRVRYGQKISTNSNPAYIVNLALLI